MARESEAGVRGDGAQMVTALEARLAQNPRDLEA